MAKVKLVHLISSLQVGGAEAVLYALVKKLDKRSFNQTVIYFHEGPYAKIIRDLGIKTLRVKGLLFPYDPVFFFRLFREIKNASPDCLHTVLWSAGFVGRIIAHLLKIPVVHALHNAIDHNGWVRNSLDWITAAWSEYVVAVSGSVAGSIKEKAPWYKQTTVTLIHNGIDSSLVAKLSREQQKTRKQFGLSEKHFIIGSVGRFEPIKNYGLLLTSFALLYDDFPQARLVLVGSGPQEMFLRMRAFDLAIDERVIFVTGQASYGYYPLFDCFVLPSLSEGLSIALLEAMSMEKTCIVTTDFQKHDIIENGKNGLLVSTGNASKLADSLASCIKNKKLATQLAQEAKRTVEQSFCVDTMVRSYAQLCQKVAQEV